MHFVLHDQLATDAEYTDLEGESATHGVNPAVATLQTDKQNQTIIKHSLKSSYKKE